MDQNPNDISRNTQQTQDAQAGAQQTTQTSQMPPMAGQMPQKAKFDFKKYKLPIIIAAIAVVVIVVAIVVYWAVLHWISASIMQSKLTDLMGMGLLPSNRFQTRPRIRNW